MIQVSEPLNGYDDTTQPPPKLELHPVYRDITIVNMQSHMHARGMGFEARVDENAPFYVNDRWEGVPVQSYDAFTIKAGSKIDFHCDYRNTSGTPIYMGPRTTDEMCVLVGSYYPADPRTSRCLGPSGELFGGDWIGKGGNTCAQTMECLQGAQGFKAMTDCMMDAAPSVSHASSALFGCMLRTAHPETECSQEAQACADQ